MKQNRNKSLTVILTSLEKLDEDDIVDVSAHPALTPFISMFPKKFFDDFTLTKSELVTILDGVVLTVHTNRTLPIVCEGAKCPNKHICPLDKGGIAPMGHECVIERMSMIEWRRQYIESLEIDPNDKIQSEMVDELVEIDIFNKFRFPVILSMNLEGFHENVDTYSEKTGSLIQSRKEVSKAFEAKMAMARRREVILRELLATPMQKVKYKVGKRKDDATDLMDITAKAEVLIETIDDTEPSTDTD